MRMVAKSDVSMLLHRFAWAAEPWEMELAAYRERRERWEREKLAIPARWTESAQEREATLCEIQAD